MLHKKELFREFETERLANIWSEDRPDVQSENLENKLPSLEDNLETAAETPEKSKEAAEEAAEKAIEEGEVAARKAGDDPENPEEEERISKTEREKNESDTSEESSELGSERLNNSLSNRNIILSSLFDDPKIRFELMDFIGKPKGEADSIDKDAFIRDLSMNRKFSRIVDNLSEVEVSEPFELSKKNRELIVKAISEGTDSADLKKHSTEEINILKNAPTNFEGNATLENLLGQEGLALLSMKYEIKTDEKTKVASIKINSKWVSLTDQNSLDEVIASLPSHIQEAYANKVNDPESYKKLLVDQLKANKSIIDLKQAIEGGKAIEGKNMDWSGYLKMIMQILPMIKKAMEGDETAIKDMTDAYNHFNETGENPLDAMNSAKTAYTEKLDEIVKGNDPSTLEDLLSMHANPNGEVADNLFYTADGPMKFRSQLRSAIEVNMTNILSKNGRVELQSMSTSEDGNSSRVSIVKNGKYYDVDLYKVDGQFKMNINEWSSGENPQVIAQSQSIPLANLNSIGDHFNTLQPLSPPANSNETTTTDKAEGADKPEGGNGSKPEPESK